MTRMTLSDGPYSCRTAHTVWIHAAIAKFKFFRRRVLIIMLTMSLPSINILELIQSSIKCSTPMFVKVQSKVETFLCTPACDLSDTHVPFGWSSLVSWDTCVAGRTVPYGNLWWWLSLPNLLIGDLVFQFNVAIKINLRAPVRLQASAPTLCSWTILSPMSENSCRSSLWHLAR